MRHFTQLFYDVLTDPSGPLKAKVLFDGIIGWMLGIGFGFWGMLEAVRFLRKLLR